MGATFFQRLWAVAGIFCIASLCLGAVASCDRADARQVRPAAVDQVETSKSREIVRQGVLQNGLRYAVMSNAKPGGAMSVRFYVETGSLNEADEERGAAHYLEHMAFEGGRNVSGDTLSSRFQEAGISIERDHNAFTNLLGTYYVLDLQEVTQKKLDLAFLWLKDVADGLTIDPSAVDRQRGVVTSEYYARRDGGTNVSEAIQAFLTPGLKAPYRSPGGTPETLKVLNADALRGFYRKWYRPDRAFVIVVGDLPVADMVARVETTFGAWRSDAPVPSPVDPGRLDLSRQTSVLSVYTPAFAQGVIDVCRPTAADAHLAPGVDAWRRSLSDVSWMLPLQDRLDHLSRAPEAPFLSARIDRSEQPGVYAMTCIYAVPKPERWFETLTTLSDELRRLELHGVTDGELDRVMTVIGARVDGLVSTSRTSPQIAQSLISTMRERDPIVSPVKIRENFEEARRQFTRSDIALSLQRRWSAAAQPQIAAVSLVPITYQQLGVAWRMAQGRPDPGPPANAHPPSWAYADLGPTGIVVSRQEILDPDFVRLTLANGVRANVKTLVTEKDHVEIRVRFGGGELSFAPKDLPVAFIGAGSVIAGGLGRHDEEQLGQVLDAHAAGVRFAMERDHFTLAGGARKADAALVAQVLCAYLTDPGFRPEADRQIPLSVRSYYTNLRVSPLLTAQLTLRAALPGPPVLSLPPEDVAARLTATDFGRVFKPTMTKDAIEVTVVGDISEAEATRLLESTFGALPPRASASDVFNPDAVRLRFPNRPPQIEPARHVGLPSKAGVLVVWPTFVWRPEHQREVRAITLLREVLSDRIRRVIRERLGQTYSPDVAYVTEKGGDEGALSVAIETSPASLDEVVKEIRSIGKSLAQADITTEELERVRRPLLDDTAHRRETASWWLNTLDGSFSEPYKLAQARTWQADYSSIPVAEVNAVARRWLAREPIVAEALPDQGLDKLRKSGD